MNSLADCSVGSLMPTPKLFSAPAPWWPAAMMPGPAPVITIQPRAAISRANSRAATYSPCCSSVRAEPKMLTFWRVAVRREDAEGAAKLAQGARDELDLAAVGAARHPERRLDDVLDEVRILDLGAGDQRADAVIERAVAGAGAAPHALPRRREPPGCRFERFDAGDGGLLLVRHVS